MDHFVCSMHHTIYTKESHKAVRSLTISQTNHKVKDNSLNISMEQVIKPSFPGMHVLLVRSYRDRAKSLSYQ